MCAHVAKCAVAMLELLARAARTKLVAADLAFVARKRALRLLPSRQHRLFVLDRVFEFVVLRVDLRELDALKPRFFALARRSRVLFDIVNLTTQLAMPTLHTRQGPAHAALAHRLKSKYDRAEDSVIGQRQSVRNIVREQHPLAIALLEALDRARRTAVFHAGLFLPCGLSIGMHLDHDVVAGTRRLALVPPNQVAGFERRQAGPKGLSRSRQASKGGEKLGRQWEKMRWVERALFCVHQHVSVFSRRARQSAKRLFKFLIALARSRFVTTT